ncbi:hypothetical protein CALCODRAFT_308159 [Calocera cornea HHB12733]|uniref:Uncharacterized protein n=1 Tax=Calocera cornea HHB12733 TaxID=1353952 RepID=A0A165FGA1_9BASI|nr:hypothetical protein CALCODRAFT_308159 [Calocera cornea HHB12733]
MESLSSFCFAACHIGSRTWAADGSKPGSSLMPLQSSDPATEFSATTTAYQASRIVRIVVSLQEVSPSAWPPSRFTPCALGSDTATIPVRNTALGAQSCRSSAD